MTPEFIDELEQRIGSEAVVRDQSELLTYESDGLVSHRSRPGVAVLPRTVEQVRAVVRACHEAGVPFVARGQGRACRAARFPNLMVC